MTGASPVRLAARALVRVPNSGKWTMSPAELRKVSLPRHRE